MIGKSHSGKTTLAKKLSEKREIIVLDVDAIDLFAKDQYPQLVDFERQKREFYSKVTFTPFLKLKIQSTVFKYAVSNGYSVILSNGHIGQSGRDYQVKLAKDLGVPLLVVYLSAPDSVLLERINKSDKGTKMLTVSKTLEEMFIKQSSVFEEPTKEEYEYFLKLDATKPSDENVNKLLRYIDSL